MEGESSGSGWGLAIHRWDWYASTFADPVSGSCSAVEISCESHRRAEAPTPLTRLDFAFEEPLCRADDACSLTPAGFWLSRPRGAMGGTGSLGVWGGLVRVTLRFCAVAGGLGLVQVEDAGKGQGKNPGER